MVLLLPEEERDEDDSKKLRALFIFTCALLLNILANGKSEAMRSEVNALIERKFRKKK